MAQEGTWVPLMGYINDVGGPLHELDTEAKQMDWVRGVCGQRIQWHKGSAGVIILDFDDGRKRVRFGQKQSTVKAQDFCGGGGRSYRCRYYFQFFFKFAFTERNEQWIVVVRLPHCELSF